MSIVDHFETQAKSFVDTKNDIKTRLSLVTSYRESIEIVHTADYGQFLRYLFPVFCDLLNEPPHFQDSEHQKVRLMILEILNRLPNNDTLRPYVSQLLHLAMYILSNDNEENAIICLRIIFDLHKNYSPLLSNEVQPFLNFFQNLYKNLPSTVSLTFSSKIQSNQIIKSTDSFRVLTECPLIVMLLFQLYNDFVESNIPLLLPYMINILNLTLPDPNNVNKTHFSHYIAALVKTISFLTYVLRGFSERMIPHMNEIARCVVSILRICPKDAINSRKELLVATRHILATEFKRGFFSQLDDLLNENVLIGDSFNSESVRPLAYMTLADLVHHMRKEMSLKQLCKVVYIFSLNIHDPTLPLQVQTASVRLALFLVDHIYKAPDSSRDQNKQLLLRIFNTVVRKFRYLCCFIPKLLVLYHEKHGPKKDPSIPSPNISSSQNWSQNHIIFHQFKYPEETVKDVVLLMNTMIFGLKTVVWCISNPSSVAQQPSPEDPLLHNSQYLLQPNFSNNQTLFTHHKDKDLSKEEECGLISQFLHFGLECFKIYSMPTSLTATTTSSGPTEHKDIIDHFASVFTVLDPRTFRNVFSHHISFLFEQLLFHENLPMLLIPQHFLANQNVSKSFADILLSFLTTPEKMVQLGNEDHPLSTVLLSLYRIVFGSLTLFNQNESVLRYYLISIIHQSMDLCQNALYPMNYFQMLRVLFRSIGGGKFEILYKEFLPMLSSLLNGLMKIQQTSTRSNIREISIELCLTIPARLSSLLPYIPLLMKSCCKALLARDEGVIKLGLRTLEFWIDNLNPEYLYPHMSIVLTELMKALCSLLRPYPSHFGNTVIQILGKLGGRNRWFLLNERSMNYRHTLDKAINIEYHLAPHYSSSLPLDHIIEIVYDLFISHESSENMKKHCYEFLKRCLISLLNLGQTEINIASRFIMDISNKCDNSLSHPLFPSESEELRIMNSRILCDTSEDICRTLLKAMIIGGSDPSSQRPKVHSRSRHHHRDNEYTEKPEFYNKEQWLIRLNFIQFICRHFSLIFINSHHPSYLTSIEYLDPVVWVDALIDILSSDFRNHSVVAQHILYLFLDYLVIYINSEALIYTPVINRLITRFIHCCYINTIYSSAAGVIGISALSVRLSPHWIRENQVDLIRALIYSFQEKNPSSLRLIAMQTLDYIIKCCLGQPLPQLSLGRTFITQANYLDILKHTFMAEKDLSFFHLDDFEESKLPPFEYTLYPPLPEDIIPIWPNIMNDEEKSANLRNLIAIMSPELISVTPSIRIFSQYLFCYISELTSKSPSSILDTYKERLMAPVLQQSLISVPPAIRVGYISAAAYCLSLKPPLFEINKSLMKLLEDAIHDLDIMNYEHDDITNYWNINNAYGPNRNYSHHSSEKSNYSTYYLDKPHNVTLETNRRVETIHLLTSALLSEQLQTINNLYPHLQANILKVILKSLMSTQKDIFSVAKSCLTEIIKQRHTIILNKELLQQCFQPLLYNITTFSKLSINSLNGLYRLLELLNNYFSPILTKTILEHLHSFTDSKLLHKLRYDETTGLPRLKPGDEVKIASKLLELFHLLPIDPDQDSFIEKLVTYSINLENALPALSWYGGHGSYTSCPFRKPLLSFLSKYSSHSIRFFLRNITHRIYSNLFISILKMPASTELRNTLRLMINELITVTFHSAFLKNPLPAENSPDFFHISTSLSYLNKFNSLFPLELHMLTLDIILLLAEEKPEWLGSIQASNLVTTLFTLWDDEHFIERRKQEKNLPLWVIHESETFTQLLILLATYYSDELSTFLIQSKQIILPISVIQRLLDLYFHRSFLDFSHVSSFLNFDIPNNFSIEKKILIINHLPELFSKSSEQQKVLLLRLHIIPLLYHIFKHHNPINEIVGEKFIRFIVLFMPSEEKDTDYGEEIRIELLRLATLLIEYMHPYIISFRKDFIKFAWNHLKRDYTTSKYCAYINVCRFIDVYDTPPKIVLQVYVALLRTHQPEARQLVNQALDILIPTLPRRLPPGEHRYPTWIKWTKKIIVEEGHLVPQLIHIWSLIIRHPTLFYDTRTQFVPQMVNSLNRLGLPPGRPLEARKLAVDLADLIILWDSKFINDSDEIHTLSPTPPKTSEENISVESISEDKMEVESFDMDTEMKNKEETKRAGTPIKKGRKKNKKDGKEEKESEENEEPSTKKQKTTPIIDTFLCSTLMIEMILTFLMRLCLMTCELTETRFLSDRCLNLLKKGLQIWDKGHVKYSYIEKIVEPALFVPTPQSQLSQLQHHQKSSTHDSSHPSHSLHPSLPSLPSHDTGHYNHDRERNVLLARTLDIMNVIVANQNSDYTIDSIDGITRIINRCMYSHSDTIRRGMCSLLDLIFTVFPMHHQFNQHPIVDRFFKNLHLSIENSLSSNESKSTVFNIIAMLEIINKQYPAYLDTINDLTTHLVRLCSRLTKDLINLQPLNTDGVDDKLHRYNITQPIISSTVIKCLDLIKTRLHYMGENKKTYFQTLLLIIEKSNDSEVLLSITETLNQWIVGSNSGALSQKEKIGFIAKMTRFERLTHESNFPLKQAHYLQKLFLSMVLHLFSNIASSSQRPEWFHRIQRAFMIGLRCYDTSLRHQFTSFFHNQVGYDLHSRVNYILGGQDWESLADSFWITQALDLLLGIIIDSDRLKMKEMSFQLPSVCSLDHSTAMKYSQKDIKVNPFLRESIENHYALYNELNLKVSHIIFPLRELIYSSQQLTYFLWLQIFPTAWGHLDLNSRYNLERPIITLLSKSWLQTTKHYPNPNVVQVFIEGFLFCHNPPNISPELLKYLSGTFNSRHQIGLYLENRITEFDKRVEHTKKDPKQVSFNTLDFSPEPNTPPLSSVYDALTFIYESLNERDISIGLWSKRVRSQYSRAALALEQFGLWSRAQDMFFKALDSLHSLAQRTAGVSNPGDIPHAALLQSCAEIGIESTEYTMWEDEWIRCAKHLNQWEILYDYAHNIQLPGLQIECSWKIPDWESFQDLLSKYQFGETSQEKIYQIYLAIHEKKIQDREIHQLCDQAVQTALKEWTMLPNFISTCHIPFLRRFQCIVELQESAQILLEITSCSRHQQIPDLKNFTTTWRERLPNKWEEIPIWANILTWRNHMFSLITNTFNLPDNNVVLGCLHDTPWTVIKFAQIARKQQLSTVCLTSLAKLYAFSTMDARDAFMKLREQIKICLQSSTEIRAALNIINSTNLDYFINNQKAELFRLKGEALQSLGYGDESNTAFSTALSVQDTLGKGWLSWGIFCDRVFTVKKDLQWAEFAVCCYLQGVTHRSNRARFMLARVLWLLSYDKGGPVNQAFGRYSNLPPWVWLLWIPQILTSLARHEGSIMRTILVKIARHYPQSLYYTIRSFLIEKREMRTLKEHQPILQTGQYNGATNLEHIKSGTNAQNQAAAAAQAAVIAAAASMPQLQHIAPAPPVLSNSNSAYILPSRPLSTEPSSTNSTGVIDNMEVEGDKASTTRTLQTSHQSIEDVVVALRNFHPSLVTEVERMLDEIAKRFKPEPDEELLAAVVALFLKCFRQPITNTNDEVPSPLVATIERVCSKFFCPDPQLSNKRHLIFVERYRNRFHRDFLPVPSSLTELIHRLKRWKFHLELQVGKRDNCEIKLERLSPYLVRFQSYDIEIPGQYISDNEPIPEYNIILQQFQPDVQILHNHGFSHRRINLLGSDGLVRSFLVQYHISHITRSDERMMQLYVILNRLMMKYKETRKRHLVFHIPLVVPLTQRQRLMQYDKSFITFEEVFQYDCSLKGADVDLPLIEYRNRLRSGIHEVSEKKGSIDDLRLGIFSRITENLVPENILTAYVHHTIPSFDEFWFFRHEMACQLALSAFLSYSLSIGDRCLHKFSFSRKSAKIMNTEFYVQYSEKFAIECLEPIPFRLTQNLCHFISPFLLDGVFTATLTAVAACSARNQEILKNYLCLFLRDDMLSWNQTKINRMIDEEQRIIESNHREKVSFNVRHIIKRIHSLMPSPTIGKDPDTHAVNSQVLHLMAISRDRNILSQMSPTWFPWF